MVWHTNEVHVCKQWPQLNNYLYKEYIRYVTTHENNLFPLIKPLLFATPNNSIESVPSNKGSAFKTITNNSSEENPIGV